MGKLGNVKYALLSVLILFLLGCPPSTVIIITPSDGDHFAIGDEIAFKGSAMDPLEGELSGGSLVWRSSIDGEIGTGTEFNRNDLSEGTHIITLTANNAKGLEKTVTITIIIGNGIVTTTTTTITQQMKLESQAFAEGSTIPVKYTCDGEDISPGLSWSNTPVETKSFVLIMDDPDAPGGTWNHWLVFNISPTTKSVQEGQEPQGTQGKNSWGNLGYGGPCPPSGTHRYFFTVYALDVDTLSLAQGATKSEVETNMVSHILDQASLMGTYR